MYCTIPGVGGSVNKISKFHVKVLTRHCQASYLICGQVLFRNVLEWSLVVHDKVYFFKLRYIIWMLLGYTLRNS